jgi:hypothetical protein
MLQAASMFVLLGSVSVISAFMTLRAVKRFEKDSICTDGVIVKFWTREANWRHDPFKSAYKPIRKYVELPYYEPGSGFKVKFEINGKAKTIKIAQLFYPAQDSYQIGDRIRIRYPKKRFHRALGIHEVADGNWQRLRWRSLNLTGIGVSLFLAFVCYVIALRLSAI